MAARRDEGELYGRGLRFPPGVGPDGRMALSAGAENVRESIRVILSTDPQERVMLPEFGGGLRRFLFRPNVASTHRLIEETITRSLGRWERRIRLQGVHVGADPTEERAALALVRYEVVATGQQEELQLRVQLA